jgi:lipopolysaccharide/colanic/teichoic acid biosynthesis glycosyltransferase
MKMKKRFYISFGKRFFDLALTLPAMMVLSPVLAVTAFLVRVRLGSPVFFKQIRVGLREKPFMIYKFRTMTDKRDQDGNLLPDSQRITHLGAFLRKTSLDELPELFNIVKGDMSLVGPRPLLTQYLPYYTKRESLRHTVLPGLTGLAQVRGRNYLKWDERLETDVQYVERVSAGLDIKIIIQTVVQIVKTKDVAVVPGVVSIHLNRYRKHWNMKDPPESG